MIRELTLTSSPVHGALPDRPAIDGGLLQAAMRSHYSQPRSRGFTTGLKPSLKVQAGRKSGSPVNGAREEKMNCHPTSPAVNGGPGKTKGRKRPSPDTLLTEAIQPCRALAAEFSDNADYQKRLAALEKLHAQHFGQRSNDTENVEQRK